MNSNNRLLTIPVACSSLNNYLAVVLSLFSILVSHHLQTLTCRSLCPQLSHLQISWTMENGTLQKCLSRFTKLFISHHEQSKTWHLWHFTCCFSPSLHVFHHTSSITVPSAVSLLNILFTTGLSSHFVDKSIARGFIISFLTPGIFTPLIFQFISVIVILWARVFQVII